MAAEQEVARLVASVGVKGAEEAQSILSKLGGSVASVGQIALGAGVAGFAALAGGLALSVKAAADAQRVDAQLDAVLRSTGQAAAEQAAKWAAAQGKYVTVTASTAKEQKKLTAENKKALEHYAKLGPELTKAKARLADMEAAWARQKTHTQMGALSLQEARQKVAELTAELGRGAPKMEAVKTKTISLAQSLGLTPPVARMTKEEILRLSDSLSRITPFEDEAITSAQSLLLTFTNIGKDVFPQATEIVLDMSQALGQDLKSSAIQVGKALQDPAEGVSALRRVGVNFTEAQQKMIKGMVQSGHTLEAQKFILKELQTEFGGSAKAAGQTFAGQLTILQNQLGNLAETVGGALLPGLTGLVGAINTQVIPAAQGLADQFGPFLRGVFQQLQPVLQFFQSTLSSLFQSTKGQAPGFLSVFGAIQGAIQGLWSFLQPVLANIFAALSKFWTEVQPKLAAAWSAISIKIQEVWTWIQGFLNQNGAQIIAMLTDVWNEVSAIVEAAWAIIGGLIKIALDLISGNMEAVGKDWEEMIRGVWTAVQHFTSAAWDFIKNVIVIAWRTIGTAIMDKLGEIRTKIENTWSNVLEYLTSLPARLKTMGINMLQGLIDGFWEKADAIKNALWDIIQGAIDNIKRFLGIASPSEVFAQMGAQMADGLRMGFGTPQLDLGAAVLAGAGSSSQQISRTTYYGGITVNFNGVNAPRSQAEANDAANLFLRALRSKGLDV